VYNTSSPHVSTAIHSNAPGIYPTLVQQQNASGHSVVNFNYQGPSQAPGPKPAQEIAQGPVQGAYIVNPDAMSKAEYPFSFYIYMVTRGKSVSNRNGSVSKRKRNGRR
jgi:hypothetical protein